MSEITDSESELLPVITVPCDQKVQAIRENKAEDVDDLTFAVGDVITISKKDGAGWAFGTLADGSSGWFPLEKVELIFEQPIAEVGTKTGESALDAFIKEAKEKPATNLGPKFNKNLQMRQLSLTNFLKERPMIDQLVSQHILPSSETTKQVAEAQARLVKNQKKNRKQKPEIVTGQLQRGWRPENPLNLTEDQIDRFVEDVLLEIPVSKQKKRLTSYDDVFNGATLLQYIKARGNSLGGKWEEGLPIEVALQFAANLLERNIIFNVVDPSKTTFKPKHLYQLTCRLTDYTVLNLDKVCHTPEAAPNGHNISVTLVGEMVEVMKKYLPNFDALKKSPELVRVGLHLGELQNVSVDGLSMTTKEQMVMFVNLFNTLVMYTHAKFVPPTTAMDRRFLYENCMLYFNKKRYSLQDLENEAIKFATKDDPLLYFCLSDCTKSTPATLLLSAETYDATKVFAARHFLNRALVFDANNYEITFPKMCQRIWKDLNLTKDELVDIIHPYLAHEQRTEITNIREIGGKIEVKFSPYSFEPSYIFEESSPLSPR